MNRNLTQLRSEILDMINRSQVPINAKSIHTNLSAMPNLSSVYRALDFLQKASHIQSISIAGTNFYFTEDKHGHGHFIFCNECHEIKQFDDCVLDDLQKKLEKKYNYSITSHIVYFNGFCPECRKYREKKSMSAW